VTQCLLTGRKLKTNNLILIITEQCTTGNPVAAQAPQGTQFEALYLNMVEKAFKAALEHQSTVFEQRLADTTQNMLRQIDTLSIKSETPKVVVYETAKVIRATNP